jgi:gluconolactonase
VSSGLLAGNGLEKVASGATWAEGPVWLPERRAVRYSDINNNRILEYSESTGECTVYSDAAEYTNGRTLDLSGAVVQCSHGRRAVERDDGEATTTLVDRWLGRRLNSPNDVVVKSDGTIWFTDPSYGIQKAGEGHPARLEYGDHHVFRFDPSTGRLDPVVIDVLDAERAGLLAGRARPLRRGLLARAAGRGHRPAGAARIHAYDVGGRAAGEERAHLRRGLARPAGRHPGRPARQRLELVPGRVQVYSPAGSWSSASRCPEVVANLCFGGDDGTVLYVTATTEPLPDRHHDRRRRAARPRR